jgi:tRNA threonylcarbamoyladenosine biosynthesis protein TsaB
VGSRSGLLLAIDTSGADAGVVLTDSVGTESFLLPLDGPFARTEDLDAHVGRLLADRGITASELDAVAAVVGPGSYTGLRSGLAFLRGLAFGRAVPAVGLGSLELAAWRSANDGEHVTVVWPTGKGSSLVGGWICGAEDVEQTAEPELVTDAELAARLRERNAGRPIVTIVHASRDGARLAETLAAEPMEIRAPRDPGLLRLAALATHRVRAGRAVTIRDLLPVYVGLAAVRPATAAHARSAASNDVAHAAGPTE